MTSSVYGHERSAVATMVAWHAAICETAIFLARQISRAVLLAGRQRARRHISITVIVRNALFVFAPRTTQNGARRAAQRCMARYIIDSGLAWTKNSWHHNFAFCRALRDAIVGGIWFLPRCASRKMRADGMRIWWNNGLAVYRAANVALMPQGVGGRSYYRGLSRISAMWMARLRKRAAARRCMDDKRS